MRFEFKDSAIFILQPANLKHVNFESRKEVDLAISKVVNKIEEKRKKDI